MDKNSEAQGQPPGVNEESGASLQSYLMGYGFALVLTLASFWASSTNIGTALDESAPGEPAALMAAPSAGRRAMS